MENVNAEKSKINSVRIDKKSLKVIETDSQNPKKKEQEIKSIGQEDIARLISLEFNLPLQEVIDVLCEEKKLILQKLDQEYRVVLKNFLTLKVKTMPAKKFVSALTNKEYDVPEKRVVRVKVGEGTTDFLNKNINKKREKMCKFVKRTDN